MRFVSVPSSGDYQFLRLDLQPVGVRDAFPSPHPGIINFFDDSVRVQLTADLFPSPHPGIINFFVLKSLPRAQVGGFPSPHPGIINFFLFISFFSQLNCERFRPLIRGLSISSRLFLIPIFLIGVSVPSSGDYQFLRRVHAIALGLIEFPSPHPGIINFFSVMK